MLNKYDRAVLWELAAKMRADQLPVTAVAVGTLQVNVTYRDGVMDAWLFENPNRAREVGNAISDFIMDPAAGAIALLAVGVSPGSPAARTIFARESRKVAMT